MNERIRQLAEQAGIPAIDGVWDYNDREILCQVDGEWRVATPSEIISVLFDCEKGKEKFAELIVRECARIAQNTDLEDVEGGDSAVLRAAGEQIQKHFGVEE